MLHTLIRLVPARESRGLISLTCWSGAAAALQGLVLGLVGVVIATLLGDSPDAAWAWITALAATILAFLLVQWHAQMVAFRVGSETARALHVKLGDRLALLPLGWFTSSRTAEVIDLGTRGIPQLMSYPALLLRPALTAVLTPIVAALTLGLLDLRFTLAVLAGSVAAWTASRYAERLTGTVDARNHAAVTEANRRILEYADRQALIRTDQRPQDAGALAESLRILQRNASRSAGTVIPGLVLFSLVLNVLFAAIIGMGVAAVAGATLTVPVMLGVIVVVTRLTGLAAAGAELSAGMRMHRAVLTRLETVLRTAPLPQLTPSAGPQETCAALRESGELLRAEKVSFSYGEGARVLDDVSFSLPRHGLTAVVGPSGAGKSTLALLLARFWDPLSGRILWEDKDLRTLDPAAVAARIAIVMQDDYLLEGSIADNIRLGHPDATADEVARAAEAAGLGPLIAARTEGIDLAVGVGGRQLSGGERQRVCVARALLKNAPLTLVDEATSALDPVAARIVADAAHRLSQTGSVLVIAHNLDTVVRADQVLVLDAGRIVQRGSHEELRQAPGLFRELLAQQGG